MYQIIEEIEFDYHLFLLKKTNQIQKVPHMKMGTLSCETRIYIQYFQKSENRWLRYIFGNRV